MSTLFLDIEAAEDKLLLVGYALDDGPVVVESDFPLGLLADPGVTKVCHGDYDLRFALMHGYEVAGPFHNTMVAAWVLDENQPLDLESLTMKYTPALVKAKRLTQRGGRVYFDRLWSLDEYDKWPLRVQQRFVEYSRLDVEALRDLYITLREELADEQLETYWETEQVAYSSLLLRMETRGLPVDLVATRLLADEVRLLCDESDKVLRAEGNLPTDFNLNSPVQLREYLFSRWYQVPARLPVSLPEPDSAQWETTKVGRVWRHGHWLCKGRGLAPTPPPKKKGKKDAGLPSTASPELLYKHGDDAFVRELCIGYRRYSKLLGTYLEKFPKAALPCPIVGKTYHDDVDMDYRIFGRFNQTGTVTGRLSSNDPNLQNIPARRDLGKRVRGLFRGSFVIGDYDALEMRLMAHFSGDRRLLDVFTKADDPHELTARAIFGACDGHEDPRRDIGKTVNYAVGYGAGAKTLAKTLCLAGFPTTQAEAKGYQEVVAAFYPKLYRWMNAVIWKAKETRYIETIGGHTRHLVEGVDEDWTAKSYGERQAVNAVVQGSAADILRRVMLAWEDIAPTWGMDLIAQVHDELLWEYTKRPAADEMDMLQALCETGHGFDLRVPLRFIPTVCSDWSEK